jgi:ABC-2 type transport system permease protein
MAVYEQTYRRYKGELTEQRFRFLVPFRYALKDVFASRLVLLLLVLGGLVMLTAAVIVYLHHNASALLAINLPLDRVLPIDNVFFEKILQIESSIGFFLALIIGPGLIAPDVRNNALPLYFSRPFSPAEYVMGKLAVLLALLTVLTWVPNLLLFLFQVSLEPSWLGSHWSIAWAILAASWEWILLLSLLTLAISAWVKWKPVARVALLATFFVLGGFALVLNQVLGTRWGSVVSIGELNDIVRESLFDGRRPESIPVWAAWLGLAVASFLFLSMLRRKVRAYEVVR